MSDLNDTEKKLLQEAMKGVVPLNVAEKISPTPPARLKPLRPVRSAIDSQKTIILHDNDVTEHDANIFFARPGLQYRYLQKFRQGKMIAQSTLDLHGLTVSQARDAVSSFLSQSLSQELRVVKIIHGKGIERGAILRGKVYQWLPQVPQVLAFCTAIIKDGGTGAVYVLLKNTLSKE